MPLYQRNLDDPKIKDDLRIIKNDNQCESGFSMKEALAILEKMYDGGRCAKW